MSIAHILANKGNEVVKVEPDCRVSEVVELLNRQRIGAVLVCENDSVSGMLSERDIIRGLSGEGMSILDKPARELMTAPVVTISPSESIGSAMEMMTDRRIRHLPVMESGRIVGIVSIGDLVKKRIEDAENEAATLKDYIAGA